MPSYFTYRTTVDQVQVDPALHTLAEAMSTLDRTRKYRMMLSMLHETMSLYPKATTNSKLDLIALLYDYIFEHTGRYTWRMTAEALEFLAACRMECQTSAFMLPRDVVILTFPEGYVLPRAGLPLRSVMVGRLRSEISKNLAFKLLGSIPEPTDPANKDKMTWMAFDFGEVCHMGEDGAIVHEGYGWSAAEAPRSYINIPDDQTFEDTPMPAENFFGSEIEVAAVREGAELVAKSMWYARAKPEYVVERRIKARPHQWHPHKVHEVTVPSIYLASVRTAAEQRDTVPTGRHVRPHMRGWSLRTLVHARYKRNDDGSPKVILVEPYVVGVDSVNDLPEHQHLADVKP